MSKHLCDRQNQLKKNPRKYAALVADARHLCLDCGRGARQKKHLCRPQRIERLVGNSG